MGFLPYTKDLTTYPVGGFRALLVMMVVLAVIITSFEGQTSPVLPLLLDEMNMSLTTWGFISAGTSLAGLVAGALAGAWSDRIGRVRLLVPALFVTTAAVFAMALATNPTELFVFRVLQDFTEGFAVASTAPLIRDFSPRLGRAFGFAFWTWGPVGANFLGAALAAITLPMFNNAWESQFILQGGICLVLATIIALTIRDLSPELRAQIVADRDMAKAATEAARRTRREKPRYRELLRYPHLWAHCIAITLWLVFYITITRYGQVILTDEFGITVSQASTVMSSFWLLNLGGLLIIGLASDRLQLRKPFSFGGTLTAVVLILYFTSLMGQDVSMTHLMVNGALIGIALAVAWAPWMATFSENAEDVEPRLQGTAWSMYRVWVGLGGLALALLVPATVDSFSGDWKPWLYIAAACHAAFIPLMFLFKGPWRRSAAMRETQRLRRETLAAAEGNTPETAESATADRPS